MATGWPVSRCGEPVRWRESFPAAVLPPVTDPIPDAFLAQLWALLSDPAAIARLLRRPRLARHPRRLQVACRSPLLIRRCGWRL